MQFSKLTFQYMGKNLFKLLPFAIIPGIALAFSTRIFSVFGLFLDFQTQTATVWSTYSTFSTLFGTSGLIGILSLIIIVFFMSMLVGGVERHMKVGKFLYKKAVAKINDTIMAVMIVYLIVFGVFELAAFLTAIMIELFKMLFGGVAVYISSIIVALIYFGLLTLMAQIIFTIPSATIVGYPIRDSLSYSMRMISGRDEKIMQSLGCVIVLIFVPTAICNLLIKNPIVILVIKSIACTIFFMFINCFSMVSYFEVSNEPRRDLELAKKSYLT